MTSIRTEIDITGVEEAVSEIERVLGNLRPLMAELGIQAERVWINKFRRNGPGWAPLSETTLMRRRRGGSGAQILRDTGRLFGSISARGSEGSIYNLGSNSLEYGTNLEYAAAHQTGVPERNLPRRAFLPNDRELNPSVTRSVERFVRSLA